METQKLTEEDVAGELTLVPLHRTHNIDSFSCGRPALDNFLKKHALTAPAQGLSQTWIAVSGFGQVLGYYTLALSTIDVSTATERVAKGMPRFPIPVVLLARLAVDESVRGQGLGRILLLAAMEKAVKLGRLPITAEGEPGLPMRAMLVHALDEEAAQFYEHFGFARSPTDQLHLMMSLKQIEETLRA